MYAESKACMWRWVLADPTAFGFVFPRALDDRKTRGYKLLLWWIQAHRFSPHSKRCDRNDPFLTGEGVCPEHLMLIWEHQMFSIHFVVCQQQNKLNRTRRVEEPRVEARNRRANLLDLLFINHSQSF